MKFYRSIFQIVVVLFTGVYSLSAQNQSIDNIVAVVGDQIVLKSDIESRFLNSQAQGYTSGSDNFKIEIFEDLLIQKMMIAQAQIDSVEVTEQEVEKNLNQRIQMNIKRAGSKEILEKYLGKSIYELKNDMRDIIRDDMITERMRAKITEGLEVTPAEIREFYKSIPKDSLPLIPGVVEIQQIIKHPQVTDDEKERVIGKLRGFRERIEKGESFGKLAALYSEDPGSAHRGGELDYTPRANLVPEFANVAFNLKPKTVSKVVETEYGYHIIQLIDRKGERIKVKHILLKPKIQEEKKKEAIQQLDSIANTIREGKMTFDEAAFYFSDDKDTRNNGGLLVDLYSSSSKFQKENLPGAIGKEILKLKINEISDPFLDVSPGKELYKIIKIKSETKAHKANLADDWTILEEMLMRKKQQEIIEKWIAEKQKSTYVHLSEEYKDAKFRFGNWVK
ncbi:MAG: peptidylprolyl isomerase [Marinifilaceae bacterium]|nr:peptidylprolyl isomerase [Marinifilaceae bacterium]